MKPTLANLKSLPYGGAHYVINTNMEQFVVKAMQESGQQGCLWDTQIQDDFVQAYRAWIASTQHNTITGLEHYTTAAYSNGSTEAFDKFYLKNHDRRLRYFRGEYMYHQVAARQHFAGRHAFLEDGQLDANDCVIISAPFSDTGGIHAHTKDVLDCCDRLGVPVLMDLAYLGICAGLDIDLDHECITDVTFSLSKTFPVPHLRIGMRLTRVDDDDTLMVTNKTSYTNRLSAAVGLRLIQQFGPDHIWDTYRPVQQQLCEILQVDASPCVIFGIDHNGQYQTYNRGGTTNRLCLAKYLDSGVLPNPDLNDNLLLDNQI